MTSLWVRRQQRRRAQIERLELAWTHVLDEDVGESSIRLIRAWLGAILEIEGDAALAAAENLPEHRVGVPSAVHPMRRAGLPVGDSTLMTSAPKSPRYLAVPGPATTVAMSTTHTPVNASFRSLGPRPRREEHRRRNVHTMSRCWLKPVVSTVRMPSPGRDAEGRTASTVVSPYKVSPWCTGHVAQFLCAEVGDRPPGDVGHAHAEQQGVDERADHDVAAAEISVSAKWASTCNGLTAIVNRQNRWSSDWVIVLPGQCVNVSPVRSPQGTHQANVAGDVRP